MTGSDSKILRLSKHSGFPDVDLQAIEAAIALARQQVTGVFSYEEIVVQAIANLPDGISSFERGVVSGIVLLR